MRRANKKAAGGEVLRPPPLCRVPRSVLFAGQTFYDRESARNRELSSCGIGHKPIVALCEFPAETVAADFAFAFHHRPHGRTAFGDETAAFEGISFFSETGRVVVVNQAFDFASFVATDGFRCDFAFLNRLSPNLSKSNMLIARSRGSPRYFSCSLTRDSPHQFSI